MRGVDKPAKGGVVLHAYVGAARCEEDHRGSLGQGIEAACGRDSLLALFTKARSDEGGWPITFSYSLTHMVTDGLTRG